MFYSHELLKYRRGNMWVVWILGNNFDATTKALAKLKRGDITKVKIARICREISEMIPCQGQHLSLRLASTLVLGTADCHLRQIRFFTDEVKRYRLPKHRPRLDDIDAGLNAIPNLLEWEGEMWAAMDTDLGRLDLDKMVVNQANLEDITMREAQNMEVADEEDGFGVLTGVDLMNHDFLGDDPQKPPAEELNLNEPTLADDTEMEQPPVPLPATAGDPLHEVEVEMNGTRQQQRGDKRNTNNDVPGAPERKRKRTARYNETVQDEDDLEQDRVEAVPFDVPEVLVEDEQGHVVEQHPMEDEPAAGVVPPAAGVVPVPVAAQQVVDDASPLDSLESVSSSGTRRGFKISKKRKLKVDQKLQVSKEEMRLWAENGIATCNPISLPSVVSKKVGFEGPSFKPLLNPELRRMFIAQQTARMDEVEDLEGEEPQQHHYEDQHLEDRQHHEEQQMAGPEEPMLDLSESVLRDGSAQRSSLLLDDGSRHNSLDNAMKIGNGVDNNNEATVFEDLNTIHEEETGAAAPPELAQSDHELFGFGDDNAADAAAAANAAAVANAGGEDDVSSRNDILSLASDDFADLSDWMERIEMATERGENTIFFEDLSREIKTRRGVAIAFSKMLDLQKFGRITLDQDEYNSAISIRCN